MANSVDEQRVAEILQGDDLAPLKALLYRLTYSGGEQRAEAERIFDLCKQTNLDRVFVKLGRLIQPSPLPPPDDDTQARVTSAALLRNQLATDDWLIWTTLQLQTQYLLKSILLDSVLEQHPRAVMEKLCDTIALLASHIVPGNGWQEFFPEMFTRVSPGSSSWRQQSTLSVFEHLSQHDAETFNPYLQVLHDVFMRCLDPILVEPDVRIAALKAVVSFWVGSEQRDELRRLVPMAFLTLMEAVIGPQQTSLEDSLELLGQLAWDDPFFFAGHFNEVCDNMLLLAENGDLTEVTRRLSIEFLFELVGAGDNDRAHRRLEGTIYNVEYSIRRCIRRLFSILLKMLLVDQEEGNEYDTGIEFLDRLAIVGRGHAVLEFALDTHVPEYIKSPDWRKRRAAITALMSISEQRLELFSGPENDRNFNRLLRMVLSACKDGDPRVRWAAVTATSSLATTFGPNLQTRYHPFVLKALSNVTVGDHDPDVKVHVDAAIEAFNTNCTGR